MIKQFLKSLFQQGEQRETEPQSRPIVAARLEDRVMYSAVPGAEALAIDMSDMDLSSIDASADSVSTLEEFAISQRDISNGTTSPEEDRAEVMIGELIAIFDVQPAKITELVIVDTGVENYEQLVAGLIEDPEIKYEVIYLDSDSDGINQVSEALQSYSSLSAIHIVSHGSDGEVNLGNTSLNANALDGYAGQIAAWGNSLQPEGDILFYGCDLAATEQGQDLLETLAALCDCDVAASDDLTGHADLGGDWELEYFVGEVDTDVAFGYVAQASWYGTLDITDNLVGHYQFEENGGGTLTDTAGNQNGTFGNAASWTADQAVGTYALDFTGDATNANAYVDVADNAAQDFGSGNFTVGFWYNSTQTPSGDVHLIGDYDGSRGFVVYANGGSLNYEFSGNGGSLNNSTTFLNDGQWHHIAFTYDGSSVVRYVNGVSDLTVSASFGDLNTSNSLRFGASSATTADYEGLLDDVRIYQRALDSADIGELYALNPQNIQVDTTADVLDGNTTDIATLLANRGADGFISLREAIIASNNTAGADTIVLGANVYDLTRTGSNESFAAIGDLDIRSDITIIGAGTGQTTISASGLGDRIFDITSAGDLTLNSLSVADANTSSNGGAINNAGVLSAYDVVIRDNTGGSSGGAIENSGNVTLERVSLYDNSANGFGGAIRQTAGTLSLTNVVVSGNSTNTHGGAVFLDGGTANVNHSTFADNVTSFNTGGFLVSGGSATISNSIFADNTGGGGFTDDINGNVTSLGYNILEDYSGFTANGNDITGSYSVAARTIDPTTGHAYYAITSGDAAIDAAGGSSPATDILGVTRDANPDIGATEYIPPPPDLITTSTTGGGLSINDDGGNDAYLEADASPFNAEGQITVEVDFKVGTPATGLTTLLSYATGSNQDELYVGIDSGGEVFFRTSSNSGSGYGSITHAPELLDGNRHTLAVTWNSTGGLLNFYVDGEELGIGRNSYQTGSTIDSGGTLVIGQHQTSPGGGFDTNDTFEGTIYSARVFSDLRTEAEIAASYRSELPFDEADMLAQWNFDNLSSDGVVIETVSGNNLTLKHVAQSGFTTSEATLTFAVDENALDGTVVGTVAGIDAEREAQIASLLAADPELHYSAETGKFYKLVNTLQTWSVANSSASSELLNGIGGELVTIHSQHENAIVHSMAQSVGDVYIGATDSDVEGEFYWYADGTNTGERFWNGDSTGYTPGGAFSNFHPGEPENSPSDRDYVELDSTTGKWYVETSGNSERSVIQWDADAVLDATQALTYVIQSQTVAGAFAIDGSTGQITVADGSLLDFETDATHTVTVRVSDSEATPNTYDEDFTISLNNLVEDNNAPTDLSSGIELNADGGNDAYLIADDGGAILGGRTSFTFETQFATTSGADGTPLLSYEIGTTNTNIVLVDSVPATGYLRLLVNGSAASTSYAYSNLADGELHSVAATWDNTNGDWAIYVDGQIVGSGTGLSAGYTIATGGGLVFGQEQDGADMGYSSSQLFSGTLYDVRIWNEVRSEAEIELNYQNKFDSGSLPSGLIANWQMDGFNGSNQVVDVVSANNLSIGHATGAGFTASTPVDDLHISENATDGTSVGFVVPSDPDAPQDIVSGGKFLNATGINIQAGNSVGDWTVTKGNIDVSYYEGGPNGGVGIDLHGASLAGAISQTLATETGRQYQVVFAMSGDWNGGDTVKDLRVSLGGESHDFQLEQPDGWSTSNLLWSNRSATFTADSTSSVLTFESLDADGNRGPLVTEIQVIEIPAAVSTILNNDPTLSYDAATGKFYKLVTTAADISTAMSDAASDSLNGISGQLVTIRSDYENEVIRSMIDGKGSAFYIGATDATTEGEWNWIDEGSEADRFWNGGSGGNAASGAYENWHPGEPSESAGGEDYAVIREIDGLWIDLSGASSNGYVIEWDASEVLSNFTFSLTDDAGGRFAIDSSTGEITVADGLLIDYETATSHNVTVQVTDAAGNSYTETMSIAVDNEVDANQTVPAAQTIDEDGTPLTFVSGTSTEVSVRDSFDTTDSRMRVTLSVNDGILNLSGFSGITFVEGASGSGSLIIDGTESDINAALNNMTFTPDANFNGSVTLNMTTSLQADLDGRYEFEANASDTSSGTSNNGTLVGATTTPDATRGSDVLLLDAAGEHVEITGRFNTPANVTLAAWINLDAGIANAEVISLGNNLILRADNGGNQLSFGWYQGGGVWNELLDATINLDGAGWNHVAATFDDTNDTVTLYLNGQEAISLSTADSIDWTDDTNTTSNTYIGTHGNGTPGFDFQGRIDDARIYTRALTADEITALAADQTEASDTVDITVTAVNDAPTFELPGEAVFTEGDSGYGQNVGTLVLSDGSMLITPYENGTGDSVLTKLNADGTIDTSFGTNGYADNSNIGYIQSLTEQADGKILVSGSDGGGIFLARYEADGSIDLGFGTSGVATPFGGSFAEATDIAVQSDGSIIVVGEHGDDSVITRFTNTGTYDTSFGSGGTVLVNFGGTSERLESVTLLADDSIIAVGETSVVKMDSDGVLDTGFDTDGILNLGDNVYGSTTQADGKFVVTGYDGANLFVTRFNTDGSVDTNFGTAGTATWTGTAATGYDVAEQSDGKLVVVGHTQAYPTQWVAVRFHTDGSLDTEFGTGGAWVQTTSTDFSEAYSVGIYNDGTSEKIVIGGYTTREGFESSTWATAIRLNHDGSLDTTLGENTLDGNPTFVEDGAAVVLDADVQIFDAELSDANDFGGASLSLFRNGGSNPEDVFSASGNLVFDTGDVLRLSGTAIGSYTNTGNGALILNFAAPTTNAQVNETLQSIAYSNSSDTPPSSVQLNWTFTDGNFSSQQGSGGNGIGSGSTTVNITAVNDDPVLTQSPGGGTYNENSAGTFLDISTTVTDVDSLNFDGGVLTTSITGNGEADDRLLVRHEGTGAGQVNVVGSTIQIDGVQIATLSGGVGAGDDLLITFNTNADATDVEKVARRIAFRSVSENPSTAQRTISTTLTDGDGGTSATDTRVMNVIAINDDPTNSGGIPVDVTVTEDVLSNLNLSAINFSDVDAGSSDLTVTLSTSTGGELTLAADGNLTFGGTATDRTVTGTLANLNAYFNNTSNIQYLHGTPNTFGDNADTITVVINDNGNSGNGGGTDQTLGSANVDITAVNDAPELDNSGTMTLATITEDDTNNAGQTVASIIASAGGDRITDLDSAALEGIAIVNSSSSNIVRQYSINGGSTWNFFGTPSNTSSILLRSTDLVRIETLTNNGSTGDVFSFRAWDQTTGNAGERVDTSSNGGATAFSTDIETVAYTITSVNDAPVLDNSGNLTLDAQAEDAGAPSGIVGTVITDLVSIGGNVTDVDASSQTGIAITAAETANGTWWYTTDGGTNWNAFGAVDASNARLLAADANTRLYFQADANFAGTVADAITFHAWDQTSGTNGAVADVSENTVADQFSTVSYSNNDGTTNWTSDWLENDIDGGGAGGGRIFVRPGGDLEIRARNVSDEIHREVDLSGESSAILSFDFVNTLTGSDEIIVEASSNGGSSYTTLTGGTFTSALNTGSGTFSLDISSFIAADTNIRFFVVAAGNEDRLYVDNVQILSPSGNTGGSTAFSSTSDTASLTVTNGNDAPVLDTLGNLRLPTITEDEVNNGGQTVAQILASDGGTPISDADSGSLDGIAITTRNNGRGTWQYSTNGGTTWGAVGTVSETEALLLRATDMVRFAPDSQNGNPTDRTFEFRAWDQTSGTAGTKVDTTTNGGSTAFSTAIESASITTTDVNDAPVLDNSANLTLNSQAEDAGAPVGAVGTVITDLVSTGGNVTDVDASFQTGIAITAADTTNGTWWYSTDSGTTWNALGAVSESSARVLNAASNTRIYFQSNADYNGTIANAITFRAWDRSVGTNGSLQDASTTGGTSAFSTASETADITITAVNDVPTIVNLAGDVLNYTEGDGAVVIEQAGNAVVSDVDSSDFGGGTLTVSFASGSDAAEDVLAIRNQGTSAGQIGISGSDVTFGGTIIGTFTGGSSGTDLVVTFNSNATSVAVTMVVQNTTYENTDTLLPTAGSRQVEFTVTDGDGGTSVAHTATVSVGGTNDAPVIVSGPGGGTYNENAPGTFFNNAITIADADSADLNGGVMTVTITNNADPAGTDRLTILDGANVTRVGDSVRYDFGAGAVEVGTVTAGSGIGSTALEITFNANANPTAVQAVAQRIVFNSVSEDPSELQRTLTLQLTDGDGGTSNTATRVMNVVAINDAPVLQNGNGIGYSEGSGALAFTAASITDADSVNFDGGVLTFSITSGNDGTDTLTLANFAGVSLSGTNVRVSGVTVGTISGNQTNGPLSITFNANAALSDVQAVYRATSIRNLTDNPNAGVRVISAVLTDGDGGTSNTATANPTLTAINDNPSNTGTLPTDATFTEDVATAIDLSGIVLADPDANSGELTLKLNAGNGTLTAAASAGITLTGNGSSALTVRGTLASLNTYLQTTSNITYLHSTPHTNGNDVDTIAVAVNDNGNTGSLGGNDVSLGSVNVDITAVNDAPTGLPVITGIVSEDQTIAADTSGISDADGLGAFGYQWTRDGVDIGGATASTYTLTDADVGSVIRVEVSYTDTDGTAEGPLVSNPTAAVSNVNDVPVLVNNTLTILEDSTVVLSAANLSATDADNADSGLTFNVSGVTAGHFAFANSPQATITSFTQAQVTSGQIIFRHDNSETAPSYSISVSDGTAATAPAAASITFTNVNDAPVLSALGGDAVAIFNDGVAVGIDVNSAATLIDAETPADYAGAVLQISGSGFQAADLLSLSTTGTVTLSTGFSNGSTVSVSGTNVGTLSGVTASSATVTFNANATAASVNTLLRAVTFETTSTTLGNREVAFSFNDADGTANGGVEQSATVTANVWVAQAGDGLVTTNEDATYTFVATDFDFTGITGSNLQFIEVLSLPANGTLTLNGAAISTGQVITKAAIDSGLFRFVPVANENGVGYASFDFRVNNGNPTVTVLAGETNTYTVGGTSLPATNAILANTDNFGVSGTYSSNIAIVGQSNTIDAAYLAQGDVLFNGFVVDSAWTAPELSAVDTWVQNGGVLISTSDASSYDAVSAFYGLTIGGTASTTWHVADQTSPIMNGAFGLVGTNGSAFTATGSISYFNSASLTVGDQVLAVDSVSGEPTMVLRQVGSGMILFTGDEGIFRGNMTGGGTIATANDRLVANIFAWAGDQLPSVSSATMNINVNAVNDDPFNSGSVPVSVTVDEDVTTSVDLSSINLGDVDSATGNLTVTLTTSGGGTLSGVSAGGVTVTGTGTDSLQLDGTVADLNTFLNNASAVSFTGAANVHGLSADSIAISITDNGNVGSGGGGLIALGTVNVDITPVNDNPVGLPVVAGTVEEDQTLTADTSGISDADGLGTFSYQWLRNGVAISGATASTYTLGDADVNTQISVEVSYTDSDGTAEGPLTSLQTVPVVNINDVPVGLPAIVGTVEEDQTISVDVSGISDNDGLGAISYQWLRDGVAIVGETGTSYTLTDVDVATDITVQVTYTDGWGTAEGPLTSLPATVAGINDAPVNTVPGTQTVIEETQTPITGISIADIDANVLDVTTRLQVINGVLDVTLSGAATISAGGNSSADLTISGTVADINATLASLLYTPNLDIIGTSADILTVTTNDGGNTGSGGALQDVDTVQIDITNVNDEEVLSTNLGLTVNEGDVGSVVTRLLLETTDVDNTPTELVYSLTTEATSGTLRLSGVALSSGNTFTQADINANRLTYDHNGDEVFSDSFGFRVDDGSGTISAGTFAITITPVNDNAPVITSDGGPADAAITLAENVAAVTTVTATDADLPIQTLTFSIVGGPDSGLFTIDGGSGALAFATAPSFETRLDADGNNVYEVIVEVNDGQGLTSQQTVRVTVTDTDEFDVSPIVDNNAAANNIDENATVGTAVGIAAFSEDLDGTANTITYSLDDNAGGLFTIDSTTGVVATAAAIDYETVGNALNIVVRATSADTSTITQAYTITVNDLDEFDVTPIVDANTAADNIDENVATGTAVGITAFSEDLDATNNVVTYSLDDDAGGLFTIDSATGVVTTAAAIDYETVGSTLNITARATSQDGSTTSQAYTITVNDLDEFDVTPIVDNNSSTNDVDENTMSGATVGLTAFSEDLDGTTNSITYSLDDNAGGLFTIDSVTGVVTTTASFDLEVVGPNHTVVVRVTSADDSTAIQSFNIAINDMDEFDVTPIIDNDGSANNIEENVAVGTVVGITAFSADLDSTANIVTYSLDDDAGGLFAIDSVTGIVTTASAIDFESTGSSQNIVVRATSADGSTTTQAYAVTVNDLDEFDVTPIVDSDLTTNSINENVTAGTTVGITVFSEDLDGTTNTITYSLDDNAGGLFTIDSATGVVTTAAAIDYEAVGAGLNVIARATSADSSTITQAYTIAINDVDEFDVTPIVDNNGSIDSIDENSAAGTDAGITAFSEDLDSTTNTVVYTLDDDAGGLFSIDSATGVVSSTVAMDRESVGGVLNITVRATSQDGSSITQAYAITVNDLDEFDVTPIVDTNTADNRIDENTAIGTIVGVTAFSQDLDATTNEIVYSLDDDAAGLFSIDGTTGVVSTAAAIDFDVVGGSLTITVRATSQDGSSTNQDYTVTVNDLNDNIPVISLNQSFTVSEFAVPGTSIGSVVATDVDTVGTLQNWTIISGNDDNVFAIDTVTGELTVADVSALNFETTPGYTLTLAVEDGANVSLTQTVVVAVVDENDAPVLVPAATLNVNENSVDGTGIGSAVATDEDVGDLLSYRLLGTGLAFGIDSVSGQIAVTDVSQLDFETTTSFTLTVEVADLSGDTDSHTITVNLNDVNESPVDLVLAGNAVNENSAFGTVVGSVAGIDLDAGDSLSFSLIDNAGGRFAIDSVTGAITVTDGSLLDFEQTPSHTVSVRATDSGGLSYDESFQLTLNDVNEAPTAGDDTFTGLQLEVLNAGLVTSNDFDVDGDAIAVVLVDAPADGQLTLNTDGSFAYTPDGSFSGFDAFTYVVTDGSLYSNVATVQIEILATVSSNSSDNDDGNSGNVQNIATDTSVDTEPETPETESQSEAAADSNTVARLQHSETTTEDEVVEATVAQDVTQQIQRRADGFESIVIFLDDVPETDSLRQANRTSQSERSEAMERVSGSSGFLFAPVTTDSPFFARTSADSKIQINTEDRRDQLDQEMVLEKLVVGSTAAVSTSLSVGYVIWLLRGGSLLTTFLSSIPAWQAFDPLPVLDSFEPGEQGDNETLESIVSGEK